MLLTSLLACTGPPPSPTRVPCEAVQEPAIRLPDSDRVRMARVLDLVLASPAEVELLVDGEPWRVEPAAEVHALPVLGIGPGAHEIEARWTCTGGGTGTTGPLPLELETPQEWPVNLEVLADAPGRTGGPTLVTLRHQRGLDAVAVFDDAGEPLWEWIAPDRVVDARLAPDDTVWTVTGGEIVQLDLLGNELARYPPVDGLGPFHHEVVPTEAGLLALAFTSIEIDSYPVDVEDPEGPKAPATVESSAVVELDLDGGVLAAFELGERLDPDRVGWSSLEPSTGGYDWLHANAVAVDPVDGDLIVGVRNQDAVVELDRATGEVQWILANPDGWSEPWASLRLQADETVRWPFQAHAPMPLPDGGLLLFDNGNNGRTTPYSGTSEGLWSRVVEYGVDETSGTLTQRREWLETTNGVLFSPHFGDADLVDDGNVLAVWGAVSDGARLVELAPDGAVVWELKLPAGWSMQRAQRLPVPPM